MAFDTRGERKAELGMRKDKESEGCKVIQTQSMPVLPYMFVQCMTVTVSYLSQKHMVGSILQASGSKSNNRPHQLWAIRMNGIMD